MKIYIAGKLCNDEEKEFLEKIAGLCEKLGFETFLPHRDVGICSGMGDVEMIFNEDIIKGFENVDLVVADLNGLHVGAGTAWELGYAYAKGIKVVGIKTDEPVEDALDNLSAILLGSMKVVDNFDKLEKFLRGFKK